MPFLGRKKGHFGPKNPPKKPRTPNVEFVAKNSLTRKPKTYRTLKIAKNRGKVSGKESSKKTDSISP